MKKPLVLTGVGLLLLGFYLFSDTNIVKINKPKNDNLSVLDKDIPEKIEANAQTLSLSKKKSYRRLKSKKKLKKQNLHWLPPKLYLKLTGVNY